MVFTRIVKGGGRTRLFRSDQVTNSEVGAINKDQIAHMILFMLREIGFILNRGNCSPEVSLLKPLEASIRPVSAKVVSK